MERICFIHIGLHKTGSTAIQQLLLHDSERLHRLGYYRPLAGTGTYRHSHHDVARELDRLETDRPTPVIDQLGRELAGAGQPRFVTISAEGLSLAIDDPAMRDRLAALAARIGYRPHIIAYVRPQAQAINSAFTQHVKTWRTRQNFAQYFKARLMHPSLNYNLRLGPLLADPRFEVTIRPYSRAVLATGLAMDFLTALSLPAAEAAAFSAPRPFNVSPGPKTIAAMQHIARKLHGEEQSIPLAILAAMSRPLISIADGYGWNATRFDGIDAERLDVVQRRFAGSNDAFAEAAWGRTWFDVFPEEKDRPAALRMFNPKTASAEERRQFLDFVSEAMAAIREFAAKGDAPFLSQTDEAI